MNKDNILTGKTTVDVSMWGGEYIVIVENKYMVCDSITNKDEAELIAESLNVLTETGLTPNELLKSQKTNYEIAKALTEKENEYLEEIEQLQQKQFEDDRYIDNLIEEKNQLQQERDEACKLLVQTKGTIDCTINRMEKKGLSVNEITSIKMQITDFLESLNTPQEEKN